MSLLAWIDFDDAERQRAQRVMALFQERETRDELGLGAIRNSIADHLFPRTSTIQTRLHYMLFIHWLYRALVAADAKEYLLHSSQKLEEQADGSLIVRFQAGGGLEMCWHLFTWGRHLIVLAPKKLSTLLNDHLQKVAAANTVPPRAKR